MQFKVKMVSTDDDRATDIVVEGDKEEIERFWKVGLHACAHVMVGPCETRQWSYVTRQGPGLCASHAHTSPTSSSVQNQGWSHPRLRMPPACMHPYAAGCQENSQRCEGRFICPPQLRAPLMIGDGMSAGCWLQVDSRGLCASMRVDQQPCTTCCLAGAGAG